MRDFNDFKEYLTDAVNYIEETPTNEIEIYEYGPISNLAYYLDLRIKPIFLNDMKYQAFVLSSNHYDLRDITTVINIPTQEQLNDDKYIEDLYHNLIAFRELLDEYETYYYPDQPNETADELYEQIMNTIQNIEDNF